MVLNEPLFKDCYDFIRNKYENTIIFPMGVDTINRVLTDYIYSNNVFLEKRLEAHFKKTEFVIYHRNEDIYDKFVEYYKTVGYIHIIENNVHKDISSSRIRELLENNDLEELKHHVSEKVYENLIKKVD